MVYTLTLERIETLLAIGENFVAIRRVFVAIQEVYLAILPSLLAIKDSPISDSIRQPIKRGCPKSHCNDFWGQPSFHIQKSTKSVFKK